MFFDLKVLGCDQEPWNIKMSFLELEGLHVFVTGAAGGIGSAIVEEFLGKL